MSTTALQINDFYAQQATC